MFNIFLENQTYLNTNHFDTTCTNFLQENILRYIILTFQEGFLSRFTSPIPKPNETKM